MLLYSHFYLLSPKRSGRQTLNYVVDVVIGDVVILKKSSGFTMQCRGFRYSRQVIHHAAPLVILNSNRL